VKPVDTSVLNFYDQLAADYHLIFADWQASVRRQGEILARLLGDFHIAPPASILDCACGIGTQAIGLAMRGYQLHATDLSPQSVMRVTEEALRFDVRITTGVADMRQLSSQVDGTYAAVIACDNALPHLLEDSELLVAVQSIATKLQPGGLFLASIRDYDALIEEKPPATVPHVIDSPNGQRIIFQVWEWAGEIYTLHHFIVQQQGADWLTTRRSTRYRALRRAELSHALEMVGLVNIGWHQPEATGFYQPIVTARYQPHV
jgi:glycine/sarcosine N-methyltransferase